MPKLRPRRGPRKRRSRSRSPGYGFHYETLDHLLSVAEQGPAIWVASELHANTALPQAGGFSARRGGRVRALGLGLPDLFQAAAAAQRLDGAVELVQRLDGRAVA